MSGLISQVAMPVGYVVCQLLRKVCDKFFISFAMGDFFGGGERDCLYYLLNERHYSGLASAS